MNTRLENWAVCSPGDEYTPPELLSPRLQGNVYNHPLTDRHPDGKFIVTSTPQGKRNGKVVTKSGTEYELGTVDPEFERAFPNARERVFNTLKEI